MYSNLYLKNFPGRNPQTPVFKGGERGERRKGKVGKGEGRERVGREKVGKEEGRERGPLGAPTLRKSWLRPCFGGA